jgi:hypothetical protein
MPDPRGIYMTAVCYDEKSLKNRKTAPKGCLLEKKGKKEIELK